MMTPQEIEQMRAEHSRQMKMLEADCEEAHAEVLRLTEERAAMAEELARLREALAHTAEQALAHEIPVGYGPEDKGQWTKGYDAAIRHARAALSHTGMTAPRGTV